MLKLRSQHDPISQNLTRLKVECEIRLRMVRKLKADNEDSLFRHYLPLNS